MAHTCTGIVRSTRRVSVEATAVVKSRDSSNRPTTASVCRLVSRSAAETSSRLTESIRESTWSTESSSP
jgi:hypothetical protein